MPSPVGPINPISLCHLSVLDADATGLIEAAAYAEISYVSMRVTPRDSLDPTRPLVGDSISIKKVSQLLRHTGIQILEIEAAWLTPEFNLNELERALELGVLFGSRNLLAIGFDSERGRLEENLRRSYELAEKYQHRLMLEFIPYSSIATLKEADEILNTVEAINAGIVTDALHLKRSGGAPGDLKYFDQSRFPYLQICDAPLVSPPTYNLRAEARERRLSPGDGELWLTELIGCFSAEAPICIEVPNKFHAVLSPKERAKLYAGVTRKLLTGRAINVSI